MKELEEYVPDDEQSLSDEAEQDDGEDCENDQADDDAYADCPSFSSVDPNMLNYTVGGFESSSISTNYSPSTEVDFTMDVNMPLSAMSFDDMLSQGTGMYNAGEIFYGGAPRFPSEQTLAHGHV